MAASLFSADTTAATVRRFDARARRRLREADTAERALVADLRSQLLVLQADLRDVFAGNAAAPFPIVLTNVERRVAATTATMVASTSDHLAANATAGAALVDELLGIAGSYARLPAADHGPLLARISRHARLLLTSATDIITMAASSQLSLLQADRQTLTATLDAIGTRLEGSVVLGRAAERVAGASTALTGEAFGQAQNDRAETHPDGHALRKRWVSSHKSDARSEHTRAEGRYMVGGSIGPIPYRDDFTVGPYRTPYPRGPGLPGAQKVHCGCRSVPVLIPPGDER